MGLEFTVSIPDCDIERYQKAGMAHNQIINMVREYIKDSIDISINNRFPNAEVKFFTNTHYKAPSPKRLSDNE